MKFYNRATELDILNRTLAQSTNSACFTALIGRRRVGKTALMMNAYQTQIFIFVCVP